MKRPMTRFALPALLPVLICISAASAAPSAPPVPATRGASAAASLPGDSVYQLSLPLTDQDGRRADWRTRRGKPQLVSMFYTSCQYTCPLVVDSGKAVERQLTPAQQRQLGILLISMDPTRDTPAALKAVAEQRKHDPRRWTLASPSPDQVRTVAGVLGIRYRQLADGEFNHTSALVLLDANGRILAAPSAWGASPIRSSSPTCAGR